MRATSARTFLNEGEKENKIRGVGIGQRVWKKKKTYGWNEIKNPNWEMLPQYFYHKF